MPAVDSKTAPADKIDLTTPPPLLREYPPTHACDKDVSSRVPCQHNTQASLNNWTNTVSNKIIWH